MLWRVNVGGDNCIYELDPIFRVATGNKICGAPWTAFSQRGLAYDVATDTYYVGGTNEGVIYHVDATRSRARLGVRRRSRSRASPSTARRATSSR